MMGTDPTEEDEPADVELSVVVKVAGTDVEVLVVGPREGGGALAYMSSSSST